MPLNPCSNKPSHSRPAIRQVKGGCFQPVPLLPLSKQLPLLHSYILHHVAIWVLLLTPLAPVSAPGFQLARQRTGTTAGTLLRQSCFPQPISLLMWQSCQSHKWYIRCHIFGRPKDERMTITHGSLKNSGSLLSQPICCQEFTNIWKLMSAKRRFGLS